MFIVFLLILSSCLLSTTGRKLAAENSISYEHGNLRKHIIMPKKFLIRPRIHRRSIQEETCITIQTCVDVFKIFLNKNGLGLFKLPSK